MRGISTCYTSICTPDIGLSRQYNMSWPSLYWETGLQSWCYTLFSSCNYFEVFEHKSTKENFPMKNKDNNPANSQLLCCYNYLFKINKIKKNKNKINKIPVKIYGDIDSLQVRTSLSQQTTQLGFYTLWNHMPEMMSKMTS